MKKLELVRKLERFPLFTTNDAAKVTGKSAAAVRKLLYRMFKEGAIKRIERGKYTLYEDPLIFSSYITAPSYLSLWTALRYYNMTQQQPSGFFVMCRVKRKSIVLRDSEILFFSTRHLFGYKKLRYADFDIFMAEPEKAIIDALLFGLPIEDVSQALEFDNLDFKKLAGYAKRTGNASLIKRLGYLLESEKGNSYGLKALDYNYAPLDVYRKRRGKKDKKWRILINARL